MLSSVIMAHLAFPTEAKNQQINGIGLGWFHSTAACRYAPEIRNRPVPMSRSCACWRGGGPVARRLSLRRSPLRLLAFGLRHFTPKFDGRLPATSLSRKDLALVLASYRRILVTEGVRRQRLELAL